MSNFQIGSAHAPPAAIVRQIEAPKPPIAQSDHKPANPATSSRGPAVVLSGALAKPPERHGQQAQSDSQPQPEAQGTGQHINHVI